MKAECSSFDQNDFGVCKRQVHLGYAAARLMIKARPVGILSKTEPATPTFQASCFQFFSQVGIREFLNLILRYPTWTKVNGVVIELSNKDWDFVSFVVCSVTAKYEGVKVLTGQSYNTAWQVLSNI